MTRPAVTLISFSQQPYEIDAIFAWVRIPAGSGWHTPRGNWSEGNEGSASRGVGRTNGNNQGWWGIRGLAAVTAGGSDPPLVLKGFLELRTWLPILTETLWGRYYSDSHFKAAIVRHRAFMSLAQGHYTANKWKSGDLNPRREWLKEQYSDRLHILHLWETIVATSQFLHSLPLFLPLWPGTDAFLNYLQVNCRYHSTLTCTP